MTVPWLRWLAAGLLLQSLGIALSLAHVGFVVDKVHWDSFLI
jgi:hypothetical protein